MNVIPCYRLQVTPTKSDIATEQEGRLDVILTMSEWSINQHVDLFMRQKLSCAFLCRNLLFCIQFVHWVVSNQRFSYRRIQGVVESCNKSVLRILSYKYLFTFIRVFGSLKIQIQRLVFEIINKEKTPFLVNISKLTMWTE